jgi:peptidoglycan/LPS O-acetylase OafA/YrhL
MQKLCAYLITFTGFMTCLMDTYYWNSGQQFNAIHSAIIFSTCRIMWSISSSLLIWLCISGNASVVNSFLSAKVFVPLSRLTYSVYLTHVWIIWLFIGSRRERIDTNEKDIFLIYLHNLVLAYLIGFVFSVLFEMPIFRMQKRFFNRFFAEEPELEELKEQKLQINLLKI